MPVRRGTGPRSATIIDLHSLQADAVFPYVIQRLAAVYGLREAVLGRALFPGIIEALGQERRAAPAAGQPAVPASRCRDGAPQPWRRHPATTAAADSGFGITPSCVLQGGSLS